MTAYARAEKRSELHATVIEIRSYNSKHLDIALHLARPYVALEERIKGAVATHVHRGRVDLRIDITELGDDSQTFEIDWPRANAYLEALQRLQQTLDLPGDLTLDQVVAAGGIIKPAEKERNLIPVWSVVETCLEEALLALDHMRQREGDALAADIHRRLDDIGSQLGVIEKSSEGLLGIYQAKLLERIQTLTQGNVEIDPSRIAQEAAFLADRSDISEEVVRAASHLEQFRSIVAGEAPAGRKLNFLLQEFNREFNTMGAKTSRTDIAHRVVDLKSEIEKIREQVQNIE
ncbi:MAG: YicC/YloC family endoribonuclease [Desulfobacterales bacterium]|jgi:uncharacterized protein (TIGR00255 family)